jgi:de-etiolated-1
MNNLSNKKLTRASGWRSATAESSSTGYRSINRHSNNLQTKAFNENCLTGMKQRILSFFYKEALENNLVNQFYANFNSIINLKMYKMQLLDNRHVLIKYVNYDNMISQRLNNGINFSSASFIPNMSFVNTIQVNSNTSTPGKLSRAFKKNIIYLTFV